MDSGAPFYDCYETSDGRWMSVGTLEPRFYGNLLELLRLEPDDLPGAQYDKAAWPALKRVIAGRFVQHDRAYWTAREPLTGALPLGAVVGPGAPTVPATTAEPPPPRFGAGTRG